MAAITRAAEGFTRVGKRHGKHKKGYRRPAPRIDHGTPELQAKRRAIVGYEVKNRVIVPRDAQKSAFPLDAMLERGYINADQYSAGRRYAWLYAKRLGRKLDPSEPTGSDPTPCGDAVACPSCQDCSPRKIALAFRRAEEAIPDRRAKEALENVAVYSRWPRWFLVEAGRIIVHRPSDHADRMALLRALTALAASGCVMREREAA